MQKELTQFFFTFELFHIPSSTGTAVIKDNEMNLFIYFNDFTILTLFR